MDVIGIHRCSILLLLLTSANLLLSHGSSAGILLSPPLSLSMCISHYTTYSFPCDFHLAYFCFKNVFFFLKSPHRFWFASITGFNSASEHMFWDWVRWSEVGRLVVMYRCNKMDSYLQIGRLVLDGSSSASWKWKK